MMNEGGNKGGPAKKTRGVGQPMKRGGYRMPFDGKNECGSPPLSKASVNRSGGSKQPMGGKGLTGGSGSGNEMS